MNTRYKNQSAVENEQSTSTFIPYGNHVTDNVVKLVSGDYLITFRLQGAAHESADIQNVNIWHDQLNNMMRNIASPKVALWSHVIRREFSEFPAGEFDNGFAKDLNDKYRAHMSNTRMLVNELYVTIVFRPQPLKAAKLFDYFSKKSKELLGIQQTDELEALSAISGAVTAALDRYEPRMLGCYEHRGVMFSEVQEFLAFIVNGRWTRQSVSYSDIRDTLMQSRPFFGKGGLMSLKGPTEIAYSAILSIQEYPSMSCPGLLNDLLSMPFEFTLSQSFTFLSKPVAMGRMNRQQARMINAGDVARSQIENIDDALDDLQSNRFVMGAHSLTLMIRGATQKDLNEYIDEAGAALSDSGMKWAREEAPFGRNCRVTLNIACELGISPARTLRVSAVSTITRLVIFGTTNGEMPSPCSRRRAARRITSISTSRTRRVASTPITRTSPTQLSSASLVRARPSSSASFWRRRRSSASGTKGCRACCLTRTLALRSQCERWAVGTTRSRMGCRLDSTPSSCPPHRPISCSWSAWFASW